MTGPHIEILEVHAWRIDASGRVGRLRVIGVADRDNERIEVDVCVADLDRTGADWVAEGEQASGLARIVDPQRTKMGSRAVQFWDVKHFGRHAYQWVAEIDVLLAPVSAPWLKLAEALDFVRAVRPERALPVHDAMLSEIGAGNVDRWVATKGLTDYRRLAAGESVEL